MGMIDVDLYREARRNTTRPRAANGPTRRILLPTLDTEIGHRLYENMNLIAELRDPIQNVAGAL